METSPAGLQGVHWSVLSVLKKYREVPLDFLARVINHQKKDVESAVEQLEREGAVQKHDQLVSLKPAK
jgi:hypothetical protein